MYKNEPATKETGCCRQVYLAHLELQSGSWSSSGGLAPAAPMLMARRYFWVPAGKIVYLTNPAHGVLNVSGRECQTTHPLLQSPVVPGPRYLV